MIAVGAKAFVNFRLNCKIVPCKGKEEAKVEGNSIVVSIKETTLNYWLIQPNPTFLIVVDEQRWQSKHWYLQKSYYI